jgi:hypothetical protein
LFSFFCMLFLHFVIVSWKHCEDIASFRRWASHINNNNLIFLDETNLKLNAAPSSTLVAPGEQAFVVVEEDSSYASRYDMIAVCSGNEVLPPIVFTPEDRKQLNVKGVNTEMLINYIESLLTRALSGLDRYPLYLIMDNSNIHNEDKIMEELHENGCEEVKEVRFMPASSAKRLSPLDNTIFAIWKQRCKNRGLITKSNIVNVMCDEWNKIDRQLLSACYRHCSLTYGQDVYKDCPNPHWHQHE